LTRALRSTTGLAVVVAGVLGGGAVLNAIPASAASRHHHRDHRRHHQHGRRHRARAGRCRNADTPAGQGTDSELRAAVVCLVNKQRAAHGLPALRASGRLDRSAQDWTDTMVASDEFGHGDPGARVSAVGFDWSTVGENIATGFATPRRVVAAWMASQGHCQNILDPIYASVGTGVNKGEVRGFASGPGTWTQDFGLPMGRHAPSRNWGPSNGCPY
jgi:uncharacterized protein YkwD